MALDPQLNSEETAATAVDGSPFKVSAEPIVPETRGGKAAAGMLEDVLPQSYGMETLCLMARDPHSLFVYWDIDWKSAFAAGTPMPRAVHLRILDADGAEQTTQEIEPFAGHCDVKVSSADASVHGELGYFDKAGTWQVICRSETVQLPPELENGDEPADFATVPFHLSFQHMLDRLRDDHAKDESLTAMLSDLQERIAGDEGGREISAGQREVLRAVEEAAAMQPASSTQAPRNLWKQHRLERILGFGNSSLGSGFGGSSQS